MRAVMRYILSACFLVSGLLKIFSIGSFEQEVQLYGDAYIGEWVHGFSFELAVFVCIAEMIAGITSLFHILPILSCIAFVVMLACFVYLTGVNLFFPTVMGSIESCGCFGELIHFTPLTSFLKSCVLFVLALFYLYLTLSCKCSMTKGSNNDPYCIIY